MMINMTYVITISFLSVLVILSCLIKSLSRRIKIIELELQILNKVLTLKDGEELQTALTIMRNDYI